MDSKICFICVFYLSSVSYVTGKQPNIIFILADDYGWNDIGYHGSEIRTPTLDELAAGKKFAEIYFLSAV